MLNRLGQLKPWTVWILLLGFLLVAVAPPSAWARVDRKIATEGDPGDGDEYDGGGGSSGDIDGSKQTSPISFDFFGDVLKIRLVATVVNGRIVFEIRYFGRECKK